MSPGPDEGPCFQSFVWFGGTRSVFGGEAECFEGKRRGGLLQSLIKHLSSSSKFCFPNLSVTHGCSIQEVSPCLLLVLIPQFIVSSFFVLLLPPPRAHLAAASAAASSGGNGMPLLTDVSSLSSPVSLAFMYTHGATTPIHGSPRYFCA